MSKYSRREKIKAVALSNAALITVITFLVFGILLYYPISEVEQISMFGTKPLIWLQKILELIIQPILIAQLVFIITEDMKANKKK